MEKTLSAVTSAVTEAYNELLVNENTCQKVLNLESQLSELFPLFLDKLVGKLPRIMKALMFR